MYTVEGNEIQELFEIVSIFEDKPYPSFSKSV